MVSIGGGGGPVTLPDWEFPHRLPSLLAPASLSSPARKDAGKQSGNNPTPLAPPPPPPPAPAILDEAAIQVDPRVHSVSLVRRTLGDRELRILFGPKGLPDFLGLGPPAAVPVYEELIEAQQRVQRKESVKCVK